MKMALTKRRVQVAQMESHVVVALASQADRDVAMAFPITPLQKIVVMEPCTAQALKGVVAGMFTT